MLGLEDCMDIRSLHHQGLSVTEIARREGIDRKTVRKYLHEAPREYRRKPKRWKIDPFRAFPSEDYAICSPPKLLDVRETAQRGRVMGELQEPLPARSRGKQARSFRLYRSHRAASIIAAVARRLFCRYAQHGTEVTIT